MNWLSHGDKTLLGLRKIAAPYGSGKAAPSFFFRPLRKVKMDVISYGKISSDFITAIDGIIPIIFCHGLGSNRTMHSGTCKDFASHGYIVFVQDYHDDTSSYIEDQDGVGKFYDNTKEAYDFDYRRE